MRQDDHWAAAETQRQNSPDGNGEPSDLALPAATAAAAAWLRKTATERAAIHDQIVKALRADPEVIELPFSA